MFREITSEELSLLAQKLRRYDTWLVVSKWVKQFYPDLASKFTINTGFDTDDEGGLDYQVEDVIVFDDMEHELDFDFTKPMTIKIMQNEGLTEDADSYNIERALRHHWGFDDILNWGAFPWSKDRDDLAGTYNVDYFALPFDLCVREDT